MQPWTEVLTKHLLSGAVLAGCILKRFNMYRLKKSEKNKGASLQGGKATVGSYYSSQLIKTCIYLTLKTLAK